MENDTMGDSQLKKTLREQELQKRIDNKIISDSFKNFYSNDIMFGRNFQPINALKTLDDLLEQDNQREKDGFPKKIKIGKIKGRGRSGKGKVAIVPAVEEEKFLHDYRKRFDEIKTGGTGQEEEGNVIGEIPLTGEGEGEGGPGGSESGEHSIESQAYELGKVLTKKFELPNLKEKGKKRSFVKYKYDLTDRHRKVGQVLDKKDTLKKIVETNLILGNVSPDNLDPTKLIVNPNDVIYRILSREKDYESEAVVFFIRDYSGSMMGKPTDIIVRQHLMIYAWLVYQYQNRVISRFILHDTEAKEVPDFYTYHNSSIAGGTMISTAYELVNKIIEEENLAKDYNIYVFQGTDGDDWGQDRDSLIDKVKKTISYTNRTGITVVRSMWSTGAESELESCIKISGLLEDKPEKIRLDVIRQNEASDDKIVESIKRLVSENGTN